jgi:hypothetical protein
MNTPKAPTSLSDQDLDTAEGGASKAQGTLTRSEGPVRPDPTKTLTGKVKVVENGDPIFDYPDDFAP